MRAVFLRSLLVVGAGGLVLAGVLYVASTVDARPPEVLSIVLTQTLPDAPGVGLPTTSLEVTFSELIDTETAADAVRLDPAVEGSLSWSGSVLIFTPREPLGLETMYTVSVRPGLRDLAGNEMAEPPEPFTFETTGPPRVVETEPADGASGVALDAPISIRFSGLMDTASVEAALRLRPVFAHSLRWSGQELRIEPTEGLAPEAEYRVDIGSDAFDVSGVALADPVSVSFRTLTSGLDIATVIPANASDGIARTTPIAVMFDEPIDPATVSPESLLITPEVSGTIEVLDRRGASPVAEDDGVILAFTPSGPLPAEHDVRGPSRRVRRSARWWRTGPSAILDLHDGCAAGRAHQPGGVHLRSERGRQPVDDERRRERAAPALRGAHPGPRLRGCPGRHLVRGGRRPAPCPPERGRIGSAGADR